MNRALNKTTEAGGHSAEHLAELGRMVEQCLVSLVQQKQDLRLEKAIQHCMFSGGKRLRPVLTLVAAEALGVSAARALRPACTIEMIHTASLVLDDLPCMDDAKVRRGAPACHLAFGEDIAILAAVTLITEAFQVVAGSSALVDAEKVKICSIISDTLGVHGLAAGQERDLRDMIACTDIAEVKAMEHNKTCALFVTCMRIAGVLGGLTDTAAASFWKFGKHLGCAFQIFDDLLDRLGSVSSTGKDHKQDEGRATFVTLMSRAEAETLALAELQKGLAVLDAVGMRSECVNSLIETLFESYRAQLTGNTP